MSLFEHLSSLGEKGFVIGDKRVPLAPFSQICVLSIQSPFISTSSLGAFISYPGEYFVNSYWRAASTVLAQLSCLIKTRISCKSNRRYTFGTTLTFYEVRRASWEFCHFISLSLCLKPELHCRLFVRNGIGRVRSELSKPILADKVGFVMK